MPSKEIANFTYKDNDKKVSTFILTNYKGATFHFDEKTKLLKITSKNEKRLNTVFNILTVINRFI